MSFFFNLTCEHSNESSVIKKLNILKVFKALEIFEDKLKFKKLFLLQQILDIWMCVIFVTKGVMEIRFLFSVAKSGQIDCL